MPEITAITPQRKKGRFSIFVDGEFVVGVGEKVVADLALRVGKKVAGGELALIAHREETRRATDACLRLLASRPRTKKEFEDRLRVKGYEPDIVSEAIAALTRYGWVDDARFAELWVQSRSRARPEGRRRLRAELAQKGVAKEEIERAVCAVTEEDEVALARRALAKKLKALPEDAAARREEERRLAGYLQRRGFSWETIKKALAEALGAPPGEE